MAEKISIEIGLEGGAEIARQLEDIGQAGQKAFADIAKAAEGAGGFNQLKPEEVTTKLQEMGVTGAESINKIQNAVKSAGRLEMLVQGITAVETGLAALAIAAVPIGAAIVTAFTAAAKATIAFAGEVNKVNDQAIKLGEPIEKVDQFRAGLEQAGVSAKSVGEILQSKLASEQGIEGLQRFIKQLEQMPNSAARSAAAIKEFGSAGAELIRILQAGGQLTGFGPPSGLIKEEDAQKATRLAQALNELESSTNRLSTVSLAPALTIGLNVATEAVQTLGRSLEQTPWMTFLTGAQLALSPIQGLVNTVILAITQVGPAVEKSGQAAQQAGVIFTQWGTVASQAGQQASQAGTLATVGFTSYGTVVDSATSKTQAFSQSLAGIVWDAISGAGVAAWNALTGAVQTAGNAVARFAQSQVGITWNSISGDGVAAWNAITGAIQGAYDWLLKFIGLRSSAPAMGGGGGEGGGAPLGSGASPWTGPGGTTIIERFLKNFGWPAAAQGGLLGGRGTGTSDSNLAWVSRGEHIMPAHAVSQPGVLAFLEALRRSGGNLSRVLDGMGRFALGGMVPRAIPAFATGGLTGGMNNVTIQFPGLPDISGLRASSGVVEELRKSAALAQVRSGGRKPSRYA